MSRCVGKASYFFLEIILICIRDLCIMQSFSVSSGDSGNPFPLAEVKRVEM